MSRLYLKDWAEWSRWRELIERIVRHSGYCEVTPLAFPDKILGNERELAFINLALKANGNRPDDSPVFENEDSALRWMAEQIGFEFHRKADSINWLFVAAERLEEGEKP